MPDAIVRSTISEKLIEDLCALIAHGSYPAAACAALGVSHATWWRWMKAGAADHENGVDSIWRELFLRVRQAEAQSEIFAVESLRTHFAKDSRAVMAFLSRRFGERWSEKRYIRVAVEKEMAAMMRELSEGLPPDVFNMILQVLGSVEESREAESGISLDEDLGGQ
jgi:hypothetical protein